MEENFYNDELQPNRPLQLDGMAQNLLQGTAKWAKFLAIVSFIGCGLMALTAITAGLWMTPMRSSMAASGTLPGSVFAMGSGIFTATYLIMAAIYFLLALYLYRFATKAEQALLQGNNEALTESVGNLKNYFKINGILIIVALAFMALAIVIGIFAGIAVAF